MEADFLGIGGKDSAAREETGGFVFGRQAARWPFSSMVSGRQPFVFFPAAEEERSTSIAFDLLPSSGFLSAPAGDPFTSSLGFQSKSFVPPTPANPFFTAAALNQRHSLAGAPTLASPVIPRREVNPSGAAAQLTIFYAGSIKVFDDVPAEKARAIMLLASNVSRMNLAGGGPAPAAEPTKVASSLPLSRAQSVSGSNISDDLSVAPTAAAASVTSCATAPATPHAVPQARKASLARFLEKRKERVASAQPYPYPRKLEGGGGAVDRSDSLSTRLEI